MDKIRRPRSIDRSCIACSCWPHSLTHSLLVCCCVCIMSHCISRAAFLWWAIIESRLCVGGMQNPLYQQMHESYAKLSREGRSSKRLAPGTMQRVMQYRKNKGVSGS